MKIFVWRPLDEPKLEPIEVYVEVIPRIGETLLMPDTLAQHEVADVIHHPRLTGTSEVSMLTEVILAEAHAKCS